MIETFQNIDLALMQFFNQSLSNVVFDFILPWVRNKYVWVPLYIFVLALLGINYGKKGWMICIVLIIVAVVSDQMSSSFIKPMFERLRPCNNPDVLEQINLLIKCGGGYSFTSSHATNHFAFASTLGWIYRSKKWVFWTLICWAALISYSQVYVGVHYPFDIFFGALLGLTIGFIFSFVAKIRIGAL